MDSSIFFNEPTVIDHSYIDRTGRLIGGSVNPSFVITGAVSNAENVVLDFSFGKHKLKHLIDDEHGGFDHKCWVALGWSGTTRIAAAEDGGYLSPAFLLESTEDIEIVVETPHVIVKAPKSAFRFFYGLAGTDLTIYGYARTAMEQYLNDSMDRFNVSVTMGANPIASKSEEPEMFRYVHGLKASSSWGCQNIAHGHLSFIEIDSYATNVRQIAMSIAKTLDNTIFINQDNYSIDPVTGGVMISYESNDRGRFEMIIKPMAQQKYVVMETETTIEHIIEYVAAKFEPQLKSINATRLYVSEGLSKGAVVDLYHKD